MKVTKLPFQVSILSLLLSLLPVKAFAQKSEPISDADVKSVGGGPSRIFKPMITNFTQQ